MLGRDLHVFYDGPNTDWKTGLNQVICRIKTGSYTGDGATSKAITGVGFKPKYVKIWTRNAVDGTAINIHETTADIIDDNASGMSALHSSAAAGHSVQANTIISLDTDGFTVDDDGVDADPNANGVVYNYLCLG